MKRNLIAVGCGVLGVVLALMAWHAYQDHQLIDAIRANMYQQQARAAQGAPAK